jgi:hypothetical protein
MFLLAAATDVIHSGMPPLSSLQRPEDHKQPLNTLQFFGVITTGNLPNAQAFQGNAIENVIERDLSAIGIAVLARFQTASRLRAGLEFR